MWLGVGGLMTGRTMNERGEYEGHVVVPAWSVHCSSNPPSCLQGGVKLCKRCFSDVKGNAHPDRMLADLSHRCETNSHPLPSVHLFSVRPVRPRLRVHLLAV